MKTGAVYASLWYDIQKCIPAEDYLSPNGCLNLASYVPPGRGKPDLGSNFFFIDEIWVVDFLLGPKWYIAHRDVNRRGSTVLHADASDAWNLSISGRAEWVIFRREDRLGLTVWLKAHGDKSTGSKHGSHIHQQETFLTNDTLVKLEHDTGIRPFIVSQIAGQMVIIPAGCAHQVSVDPPLWHRRAESS